MKRGFDLICTFFIIAFSSISVITSCSKTEEDEDFKVWEMDLSAEAQRQGVSVSGNVAGYTYVDLGLSVKWATYNVGTKSPTEFGNYFAWGETNGKVNFSWDNYKLSNGSYSMKKYCSSDQLTVLDSGDDAATVNWGAAWRMPTSAEWKELIRNCDWYLETNFKGSGICGVVGTSLENGNEIFIPAAGYYESSSNSKQGKDIHYWSASLSSESDKGVSFYLTSSNALDPNGKSYRFTGFPVRPVLK